MFKRIFPFIFITATVATLLALGTWQLQRLNWKNSLIAQYEQAKLLPPVPFASIAPSDYKARKYHPVTVSGTFLHDKEIHLGGRRYYSKTGYELLTPLKMDNGQIALINRGWIPTEFKDAETRPSSLEETTVSITGQIRIPKEAGLFTPKNHPKKNFWFTPDYAEIEAFTGLKPLPVVIRKIDPDHPHNVFPAPSNGKVVLRNDHLGYMITWYSLAVAALVIFILRLKTRDKKTT